MLLTKHNPVAVKQLIIWHFRNGVMKFVMVGVNRKGVVGFCAKFPVNILKSKCITYY